MSRTLSKILVICAMVAIFPLLVVGTAFAAYFSVESTVHVNFYYIENVKAVGNNAKAAVVFDGSDKTSDFEIKKGQESQVNLDISAVGYEFVGWFEGAKDKYIDGESDIISPKTLTINMKEEKTYTAIFEAIKYQVSYNYIADPTVNTDQITTIVPGTEEDTTAEYVFGKELPQLKKDGWTFHGWNKYVDSSVDTTAYYTTAEFGNIARDEQGKRNVTLYAGLGASWTENTTIRINYHKGDEVVDYEDVVKADTTAYDYYGHLNSIQDKADRGYHFVGVKDKNGNSLNSQIDNLTEYEETVVDVYLVSEAVRYSASVASGDATFTGNATVEFTVEDLASTDNMTAKFGAWFQNDNWTKEYSFYTLAGLKAGESETVISNAEGLVSVLNASVDESKNSTSATEFVAQINKAFRFQVTGYTQYMASSTDTPDWFDSKLYTEDGREIPAGGKEILGACDTTITLGEFLKITSINYFKNEAGDGVAFARISVSGVSFEDGDVALDTTINDILEMIIDRGVTINWTGDNSNIATFAEMNVFFTPITAA